MTNDTILFPSPMYFSYSQFLVYDGSAGRKGFHWTEAHGRQGFARNNVNVSFSTLLEYGYADLSLRIGPFANMRPYTRVIEVPIYAPSGTVGIEGPEEWDAQRTVSVEPGYYRLIAAQLLQEDVFDPYGADNERERIDIFLERLKQPLANSRIIIADARLHPMEPLIESAELV